MIHTQVQEVVLEQGGLTDVLGKELVLVGVYVFVVEHKVLFLRGGGDVSQQGFLFLD